MKAGKTVKKVAPAKRAKSVAGTSNGDVLSTTEVGPYTVRVENYKGKASCGIHLTSRIDAGEEYTLVIGFMLTKAKAVVECFEEIEKYVADYGNGNDRE